MRVCMIPSLGNFDKEESGIRRVVEAYEKYSQQYGIEYVPKDQLFDLSAIHAGIVTGVDTSRPIVSHLHGLYWTNDYAGDSWEWRTNAKVIQTARIATIITVPSEWVAETFQRDMHINPVVIHHGIDWQDWQHDQNCGGYILWNKNRDRDVCDPSIIKILANQTRDLRYVSTFVPENTPDNVLNVGIRKHDEMKLMIQSAGVYLSTTKETFGIGALEALAAGTPVVGFAHGGNLITVQHGVNGYLARPNDVNDLIEGIRYCLKYRDTLSANARETSRGFTWEKAVEKVAQVYEDAIRTFYDKRRPHTI